MEALPGLREDLTLLPAEHDEYGSPNWTIHDPVRNRYYRIGYAAFEMLNRWFVGSVEALIQRMQTETILNISTDQVREFIRFLHANSLIERTGQDAAQEFARIERAGKPPLWKWLVHNYLFIRIPLWRPDRFLQKTLWFANLLASRRTQQLIVAVGVIGILMTLRQWDRFATTFMQFTNWQGLAWMALTLTSAKILHELGHAYTATRYGCRVPTIGIAFLVLYPVLYTDTSDAWRVTSREQRLRIGAAGIRVELALAMIATFMWHVVPAGALQSMAFLLATTTWLSTLLINLSPFMRFDGYYLLADYLRVPNLQQRAFNFARWHLREVLFGLKAQPPEPLPASRRNQLVVFAYLVWVYRFFLFLGIALVVYHLFFKALGIVLFAVEIIWFILLPVFAEFKVWWHERKRARITPRAYVIALLLLIGLVLLLIPWHHKINAPALLQAARQTPVMNVNAGRIESLLVEDGQFVEAGAELLRMTSPQLASERRLLSLQIQAAEILLAQSRSGAGALADVTRQEQEVLRLRAEMSKLAAREANLIVRAPIAGNVRDLGDTTRPGVWVPAKSLLARIVDRTSSPRIVGYVSQTDIARLDKPATARFIPEHVTAKIITIKIDSIDQLGIGALDMPQLASVNGGPINTRVTDSGLLQPTDALYRITGHVLDNPLHNSFAIFLAQRGSLEIKAPAISLAGRWYEALAAAFLREFTF